MTRFSLAGPDTLGLTQGSPDGVVLDTRPARDYWAGHLPGARHVDPSLFALQQTDAASIARFQALLGWTLSALGLSVAIQVLVHGAANEANVFRVAWALGYAGIEEVRILDGGLGAVAQATRVTEAPVFSPSPFVVQPVTSFLATWEEAAALSAERRAGVLIDARERDEFLGLRSNARRHGRIPEAVFWDARKELDDRGFFSAPVQLAGDLAALARTDDRVVSYCAGGGRAARTFIALQLAGYARSAVYPASWNEWGNRFDLPLAAADPSPVT